METQSSWLADGVKEIERISRTAMITEPKVISIPQEKPGTYGIVTPGPAGQPNAIDVRVAGPLWHNERLANPAQLKSFVGSMTERGVKPEEGAVYISESAITYVYNFEDRRHRAVCLLETTKPWDWLKSEQPPMSQRDFVRLLRIKFDGLLPADSTLLNTVRNVRWKTDGGVEGNLQRGKEALGRQITNEILGVTNFPEEFTLRLNVFESFESVVNVRIALEIIPDRQAFELIPFPSEIRNAMDTTLIWLQSDIAETKVPTFIGAVTGGKEQL